MENEGTTTQAPLGIEEIKKAVKEVIDIGMAVVKAADDGKINFAEGFGIAWELKDLYKIYNNFPQIKAEFEDLGSEDRAELLAFVAEEFELENDKSEQIIEKSFAMLLSIIELVKLIQE